MTTSTTPPPMIASLVQAKENLEKGYSTFYPLSFDDWKKFLAETAVERGYFFYDTFADISDDELRKTRRQLVKEFAECWEFAQLDDDDVPPMIERTQAGIYLQLEEIRAEIARRK